MQTKSKAVEEILVNLMPSLEPNAKSKAAPTCVSIWVPGDVREQYVELQNMTNGRFGKELKVKIIEMIEEVYKEVG